jgi:zinc transport system ATP-binding protein
VSDAELRRALDLVNLTHEVVRRPIGTLSGGQFQRLLLAFAFLGRPRVLLFDEPTAGIDEPGEEQLYERIHRLKQQEGFTLLLISHELSLVYRYATRVLCLGRDGSCIGPPTEVLTPDRLAVLYGTPMKYHVHA